VQCFKASGVADLSTLAQLSDELVSGAPELCNYEVAHIESIGIAEFYVEAGELKIE